jgi:hypothetical protein
MLKLIAKRQEGHPTWRSLREHLGDGFLPQQR